MLLIFDSGIILRIIKIVMDGQADEEINVGKAVGNHIKAAIIANLIVIFVPIIASYYR